MLSHSAALALFNCATETDIWGVQRGWQKGRESHNRNGQFISMDSAYTKLFRFESISIKNDFIPLLIFF